MLPGGRAPGYHGCMSDSSIQQTIRLGTRGSLLARTQSQQVANALAPYLLEGVRIELVIITTSGDRREDASLMESGGKGLFVKELDEALADSRIEIAVHSAKDLPMERPAGVVIGATPPRVDCRDVWVGKDGLSIEELPGGAKVGTASMRRKAQLLGMRSDLEVVALRGNIDTRLTKVAQGAEGISGTFLAAAGLKRAGLLPATAVMLPVENFIPAAGQGTLAIECRETDERVRGLLGRIHDPVTAACLCFERGIVRALAGNCLAPIGVCAQPRETEEGWLVRAIVASPDGQKVARCALMSQNEGEEGLAELSPLMVQTLAQRGAFELLAMAGR
jgi:hydroxymethylbilane synthase